MVRRGNGNLIWKLKDSQLSCLTCCLGANIISLSSSSESDSVMVFVKNYLKVKLSWVSKRIPEKVRS